MMTSTAKFVLPGLSSEMVTKDSFVEEVTASGNASCDLGRRNSAEEDDEGGRLMLAEDMTLSRRISAVEAIDEVSVGFLGGFSVVAVGASPARRSRVKPNGASSQENQGKKNCDPTITAQDLNIADAQTGQKIPS